MGGVVSDFSKVDRVVVIDHRSGGDDGTPWPHRVIQQPLRGIVFSQYHTPEMEVEVVLQDEGRTLKVFMRDRKNNPGETK